MRSNKKRYTMSRKVMKSDHLVVRGLRVRKRGGAKDRQKMVMLKLILRIFKILMTKRMNMIESYYSNYLHTIAKHLKYVKETIL